MTACMTHIAALPIFTEVPCTPVPPSDSMHDKHRTAHLLLHSMSRSEGMLTELSGFRIIKHLG